MSSTRMLGCDIGGNASGGLRRLEALDLSASESPSDSINIFGLTSISEFSPVPDNQPALFSGLASASFAFGTRGLEDGMLARNTGLPGANVDV